MNNFARHGDICRCSFGTETSAFQLSSTKHDSITEQNANLLDNKPMVNILAFGMCTSLVNPEVASATAHDLGVPVFKPCIPNTIAPWSPGLPTMLVNNYPAIDKNSKLMCAWGGVIEFIKQE